MEFKLKLGEVLNINQSLKEIIDGSDKVEALFKFRLLGIMKTFEPFVNNFETVRNGKILEYGEPTEDGNFRIPPEDKEVIEKYNSEITAVINSEVTLNIEKLKVEDVFNKGFDSTHLMSLYPILEE